MATTSTVVQQAPAVPGNKSSILPLMIAIVLGVVVSVAVVGGTGYYLIRTGKLRLQTMPPPPPPVETKTHTIALEPLLVNLADPSGAAYLRVSIALLVNDPPNAPARKEKEESLNGANDKSADGLNGANEALRDAALAVLGRETSAGLLAPDGKERLKTELKDSLIKRAPDTKIVDVYFTEFLVQR